MENEIIARTKATQQVTHVCTLFQVTSDILNTKHVESPIVTATAR